MIHLVLIRHNIKKIHTVPVCVIIAVLQLLCAMTKVLPFITQIVL